MSTKDLQNQLEKLGFSDHEAKIYLTLLDMDTTSAGPIIKKTGLHRNIVYETLDKLAARKIIIESNKRGVKQFRALNPSRILQNQEIQYNIAQSLIPQLQNIKKRERVEVVIYEGGEGWQTAYKLLRNRLKSGDTVYTLGVGADKWMKAMGDFHIPWEDFLIKDKVFNKMIAYEWQRQGIVARQSNPMRETRYLSEKYSITANTEIFKGGIFIQIYTDPTILIEIKSQEVAKSYKDRFDILWKMAKK